MSPGSCNDRSRNDSPIARTRCRHCHRRPATTMWVGSAGSLAFVHGLYEWWCQPCVLQAQLDHARDMAKKIPMLERELEAAKASVDAVPGPRS